MMAREIRITPVLNGFVCNIGCQTVVFTSVKTLQEEIGRYYKDPTKIEEEYLLNGINKQETCIDEAPMPRHAPRPGRDLRHTRPIFDPNLYRINPEGEPVAEPCPECASAESTEGDWP